MTIPSVVAPVLLAVAGAAVITAAPQADAAPSGPTCTATGANSTLCYRDGNAQVSASPPPVDYPAQYPFFGTRIFHLGHRHR
ncbi:hypothetical protein ACWDTP_03710 [Mycobacterium sp. NPDC003449]